MNGESSTAWVPAASEAIDCPLCSKTGGPVLGVMGRHGVPVRNVACADCGLVYVTPRPTQDDMAEFYRASYRTQHLIPHQTADGGTAEPGTPEFDEALAHRGRVLGASALSLGGVKPGDRVLDVGCHRGAELRAMREKVPIEAFGIEPGETEAALAMEHDIKVHVGVLETFEPGGLLFDQVQMFHVLEHLHDPVAALTTLRSFLKPEGRLVICVPDVLQPYGGLRHFFQYPHLFSFSPNTLMGMFRRAGLQPLRMMRGGVLWMVGQPDNDSAPLPRPFDPSMLASSAQDGRWVANRLLTYEGLQQALRIVRSGGALPEELVVRLYGRPGLPDHLVEVTTSLVEQLSRRGRVAQARAILEAAAAGPHSPAFTEMCRELLGRMPAAHTTSAGLAGP